MCVVDFWVENAPALFTLIITHHAVLHANVLTHVLCPHADRGPTEC